MIRMIRDNYQELQLLSFAPSAHLTSMFTQIWLRSADVRILQQLVAVHEGIEAMRWLMEERDALVSRSSSLSSLLGHGPPTSPFR